MNDFSHTTFSQQRASVIEGKILSGEYRVGDRLPTEPQLSIRFGVSRGTIREALKSLVSLGLLESRQGSGTYVMAKDRIQAAMHQMLSSTEQEYIESVRAMLEREIASSAAIERSESDLASLRRILDEAGSRLDSCGYGNAMKDFHAALSKSTHNPLLHSLYTCISEYDAKASESFESIDLYEELYEALEKQDADMARITMSRIADI